MSASLYRNYLRLCEKWGLDASKKGRDLGEVIRQEVLREFSKGEASSIRDLKDCERKYQCLNRLVSNHYGQKYKRTSDLADVSASMMSLEECKEVLSTAALEALKEQELGVWHRIKLRLGIEKQS